MYLIARYLMGVAVGLVAVALLVAYMSGFLQPPQAYTGDIVYSWKTSGNSTIVYLYNPSQLPAKALSIVALLQNNTVYVCTEKPIILYPGEEKTILCPGEAVNVSVIGGLKAGEQASNTLPPPNKTSSIETSLTPLLDLSGWTIPTLTYKTTITLSNPDTSAKALLVDLEIPGNVNKVLDTIRGLLRNVSGDIVVVRRGEELPTSLLWVNNTPHIVFLVEKPSRYEYLDLYFYNPYDKSPVKPLNANATVFYEDFSNNSIPVERGCGQGICGYKIGDLMLKKTVPPYPEVYTYNDKLFFFETTYTEDSFNMTPLPLPGGYNYTVTIVFSVTVWGSSKPVTLEIRDAYGKVVWSKTIPARSTWSGLALFKTTTSTIVFEWYSSSPSTYKIRFSIDEVRYSIVVDPLKYANVTTKLVSPAIIDLDGAWVTPAVVVPPGIFTQGARVYFNETDEPVQEPSYNTRPLPVGKNVPGVATSYSKKYAYILYNYKLPVNTLEAKTSLSMDLVGEASCRVNGVEVFSGSRSAPRYYNVLVYYSPRGGVNTEECLLSGNTTLLDIQNIIYYVSEK